MTAFYLFEKYFIFPCIQMRNVPQHISSNESCVFECIWVLGVVEMENEGQTHTSPPVLAKVLPLPFLGSGLLSSAQQVQAQGP